MSLAVRAATALRFGKENDQILSAYDIQLRRRLWYFIGLLDTHTALDRGTLPLIAADEMGPAPLNMYDSEMDSRNIPDQSVASFTEMSFSSMVYEAMMCQKKMCNSSAMYRNYSDEWKRRLCLVGEFETSMRQKYFGIPDNASPIEQITKLASREIVANMHILLRRPPYMSIRNVVPPDDDFDVIRVATEVLETSLQLKTPKFSQWAWKSWVKWYVLAVLLAELSARPESSMFDLAYDVARQSYEQHRQLIADGEKGMLWRPIVKLMRRVTQLNEDRTTRSLLHQPLEYTHYDSGQQVLHPDYESCRMLSGTQNGNEPLHSTTSNTASWLSWNAFLEDANYLDDNAYWSI